MKDIDWKDPETNRLYRVRVPDDCLPEDYGAGIRLGPPDLEPLGYPEGLETSLHNALHSRKLWTLKDVLSRPMHVQAAIQAALKLDLVRIQNLYRLDQGG